LTKEKKAEFCKEVHEHLINGARTEQTIGFSAVNKVANSSKTKNKNKKGKQDNVTWYTKCKPTPSGAKYPADKC
jgi:hypothetical protein